MIEGKRNTTKDVLKKEMTQKTNKLKEMRIKTRNRAFINKNQQETHNMSGGILYNKKTRSQRSGVPYIKMGMNSICPTDRQHKEKILDQEFRAKVRSFILET